MLNKYRSTAKTYLEPISGYLAKKQIHPNLISLFSLLSAALAAISYYKTYLFLATIFVSINSLLDALDGEVARKRNIQGDKGDFVDHLIDRYSDMFLLTGITFSIYVKTYIGVFAIVGVLLTSYLGTQAQAVGVGRIYSGIMGRADRLVLIIFSSLLTAIYPEKIFSYFILGWAIALLAVLSNITVIQRFFFVWKKLKK